MRRSNIYLRNKLSERELFLLKKDLIDHSVGVATKIKNISFTEEQIAIIATSAIDRVLFTYKFGKGGSLGELVRMQVMNDLRLEFLKSFPHLVDKITWPDLVEKKPFDKLLEILRRMKLACTVDLIEEIFDNVGDILNGRQQKILRAMFDKPTITYGEICKQFGTRGVMTYREIKIVHAQLLQTLKFLKINL
jgi:hypothetical protein